MLNSFVVSLGGPRKLGKKGRQGLVISRKHCQASRLAEQFYSWLACLFAGLFCLFGLWFWFVVSFCGVVWLFLLLHRIKGQRVGRWEDDTGNITYNSGLHGHTTGGLKAAWMKTVGTKSGNRAELRACLILCRAREQPEGYSKPVRLN